MEFNVWDIGGPASMATVNQCFFTDKALYVVVWNLALGEEAVANLQFWLLNIEVRSPHLGLLVLRTQHPRVLVWIKNKEMVHGRNTILIEGFSQRAPNHGLA